MCGIFGAIGNNINREILQEIAYEARKRGPQAYGISWLGNGEINTKKSQSAINPNNAFKGIDTKAIIGNCRLSTSGDYNCIENNQPMVLGDIVISHNGNIKSYLQIAKSVDVDLKTQCDSEIICHLAKKFGINETIKILSNEMPMALLLLQNNEIAAFRQGQSLYILNNRGCFYLCSRKFRNAELMSESQIIECGLEEYICK